MVDDPHAWTNLNIAARFHTSCLRHPRASAICLRENDKSGAHVLVVDSNADKSEAMFASNDVANGAATKLGMFSTFVTTSLRRLNLGCGLALDMPCGHGRHSLLLAMYGIDVLSADLDSAALTDTIQAAKRQPCSSILALQLDAHRPLPFRESVFDLVVVVHFSVIDIVGIVTPLLKVGGHLILETFGAQGENWKGLPKRNHVAMQLAPQFNLVVYQEAPVRRSPEHVTLKAVARRRRY